MKRFLLVILFSCLTIYNVSAQELYVFSEPASTMPANSFGVKYTSKFVEQETYGKNLISSRHMFETAFGLSKKLMIHPSVTLSDMYTNSVTRYESMGLYVKYRFLSIDEVHKHFRAAFYAKGVIGRNDLKYEELTVDGDHTAVQAGLIFTQLIHKLAISSTIGLTEVLNKERWLKYDGARHYSYQNFAYSLSAGYLLLPRQYKGFKQTNLNVYCEFMGGAAIDRSAGYFDMAPALQLIINSNSKVNVGYRFQLFGGAYRMAPSGLLVSYERSFLNAFKHKL
jgi:hypothetical protein